MVRGMAIAARHLQRPELAESAARAIEFTRKHLWVDGRLFACWKDGRARFPAYLDDHAFMLDGILELLQQRWDMGWLNFARDLADLLLDQFMDADQGGFFFTAEDHENLIHRPRPLADEATPAGNGIAALALARLGYLLGENRYLAAAERTLKMATGALQQMPHAHCALLNALEEYIDPPEIVIIRGDRQVISEWQVAASLVYAPRRLVFAIASDEQDLPAFMAAKTAGEKPLAYVCRGSTCSPPITSLSVLTAELRESSA
jgi:uncharacterized protein YyaL (SSP411 family)